MSSAKFETIFEHATSIVEARCSGLDGMPSVLDDFRRRIKTDQHDPLVNRELIVEPIIDSQRIGVPLHTVERIAEELHNLHVVHVWVRAKCPSADPEDEQTLIETDSATAFRAAVGAPCHHCGQHHSDLSWENLDTFYAFHFDGQVDQFRIRDFFVERRGYPRRLPETAGYPEAPSFGL